MKRLSCVSAGDLLTCSRRERAGSPTLLVRGERGTPAALDRVHTDVMAKDPADAAITPFPGHQRTRNVQAELNCCLGDLPAR